MQKAGKKYDKYYRIINIVQALVNLLCQMVSFSKGNHLAEIHNLKAHHLLLLHL